jgi:putative hemolysin
LQASDLSAARRWFILQAGFTVSRHGMKFRFTWFVAAASCLLACEQAPPANETPDPPLTAPAARAEPGGAQPAADSPLQRVNPAAAHCIDVGGRLVVEKRPDGSEFGVCHFEDNRQCEEWALLRGECPVGGRRITGYATQAGRYCAITGGQYTDVTGNDARDERGNCLLPDDRKCEAEAYWRGTCSR